MLFRSAWYDGPDDVLYQAPPASIYDPARHRLAVLDKDTAAAHIYNGITAARRVNPNLEFLLTVSPVPLGATFRAGCDVFTANLDSKNTLRLAARELSNQLDLDFSMLEGVHYFPSFEMAMAHPNT